MIRFFVLAMAVTATAAAQGASPSVSVREANGAYVVEARFRVAAPAGVIRRVLTDYDGIPRFMPDVRASIVRRRAGDSVIVEQEAESSFLMFSKRVHLVLDVLEADRVITFRDLCGKSFDRYEGAWTLTPDGDQAIVTYTLTADPAFKVPGSMLRRLLFALRFGQN